MLEHYFSRTSTVDRLRSLWLGPALSRYAEWLSDRQISRASALFKLQTLVIFDRFVTARHVRTLEELPAQIAPFIEEWRRTRGRNPHKGFPHPPPAPRRERGAIKREDVFFNQRTRGES